MSGSGRGVARWIAAFAFTAAAGCGSSNTQVGTTGAGGSGSTGTGDTTTSTSTGDTTTATGTGGSGGGTGGSGGGCDPAATEKCNGIDDDCDGQIDEDDPEGNVECDTGGKGVCAKGTQHCVDGALSCDATTLPAPETCNGLDDDCNGLADDGDPGGGADCSTGLDGACATGKEHCIQGVVSCMPDHGPGELPETCNDVDDDCDGFIDEGLPTTVFYQDDDKDGYGSVSTVMACKAPDGYASKPGDCNDNNPALNPGAIELCNDADDNCNGFVDEGVQKPTFYKDNDGDGFGGVTSTFACTPPAGYVAQSGDCNDFNPNIHPGAMEQCNDADDDCDGLPDNGLPLSDVYTDLDGDGFGGKNAVAKKHCLINGTDAPFGYSLVKTDCDDSKSTVYPDAPELCDGVLNNCNLSVADYHCPTKCAGSWPVAVNGSSGYPIIAQLDSDAEMEVVVHASGTTYVVNHDGSTLWTGAGTNYSYPSLGDFDHDNWLDVAVPSNGTVKLLKGTTGASIATVNSPGAGVYYGSSIFDVDNDGWADLAPFASGQLSLVRLGAGAAVLGTTTVSALANEPGFNITAITLGDLDGDGISEIGAGSGSWGCAGNLPSCKGRFFVYKTNGALYNDPTWTNPALPQFKVTGYPNAYAGEGQWGMLADFDHDGVAELMQRFSDKTYVWKTDGTDHPLSGQVPATIAYAPVNANGTLTPGDLKAVGGPIVDIEGDGTWETIGGVQGGMGIRNKGAVMDGYPIPISGGQPMVGDLNRDGALDIVWLGNNNALNCWTLKGGTYDATRVLYPGGYVTMGEPGIYPTNGYDPYEPNDPAGSPNINASINPRADFRAFVPYGLRDKFIAGGGWQRRLTGLIGTQGDEDWYWFDNSYSNITLTSHVPGKLSLDLDVYVYVPNGNNWQYTCEAHTSATPSGALYFHPVNATGTCPAGINQQKGFLVRVKGKDPAKDFGPWPYSLTFMWQ